MGNTDNEAGRPEKPSDQQIEDMLMQLDQDQIDLARLGRGGMTFDVSYCKGDTNKLPHRLAGKTPTPQLLTYAENKMIEEMLENSTGQDKNDMLAQQVKYSAAEKEVLAELFRDDILRERRDRSRKTTAAKHALAAHRRAELNSSLVDQQTLTDNATAERVKQVKEMTDEQMQVKYSATEKKLLAELFRDDILRERRDRSRQKIAAKHALAAHRRADKADQHALAARRRADSTAKQNTNE